MTKTLTLILGGARSGKSAHAQKLAREFGGKDVLFVATAQALDEEMKVRIEAHQRNRPAAWRTLEVPRRAGEAIERAGPSAVVLVDCLTLLVSNVVVALPESAGAAAAEAAALAEVEELIAAYRRGAASWIVISNEVGLGLVPPYAVGRTYRDALGRANQRLAAQAGEVLFMVAGIPMKVKHKGFPIL
jgi:adenosylcobinamide kinase/adenosylcobinamide-phosphate guanylyltransferase